jgi:3',5'-cyclic AMP phosphodiesterase CpdA
MIVRVSDWAAANGGVFTRTKGKRDEVDGFIHRDGRIVAVVEAKHREYRSGDFDTFTLDVGKAYALHSSAVVRSCRGLLIVEWSDGVMEFARFDADNDPHLKTWKRERFTPGRSSKSEGKHERMVMHVPRSEFTTIHSGW